MAEQNSVQKQVQNWDKPRNPLQITEADRKKLIEVLGPNQGRE